MGTRSAPNDSALDAELAALRHRAYGADADIDRDPAALARLVELEEWHAALLGAAHPAREAQESIAEAAESAVEPGAASLPDGPGEERPVASGAEDGLLSRVRRLGRTRAGAIAIGVIAMGVVVLAIAGVATWSAPRPDAVLSRIDVEPDAQAVGLTAYARNLMVDASTLRGFEGFLGLEVWGADSALGNECLLIMEPSTDLLLAASCAPPGADVIAQIYDVPVRSSQDWHEDLPVGTVVRFVSDGDAVEVWLYEGVPPE